MDIEREDVNQTLESRGGYGKGRYNTLQSLLKSKEISVL